MEISFNRDFLPQIVDRAGKLEAVLAKFEDEIGKLNPTQLSTETLLEVYSLTSKNHLMILEFMRKMLLIKEDDDPRLKGLMNRLLAMGEGNLAKLEKEMARLEQKPMPPVE